MDVSAYVVITLICLIPALVCAFILLVVFASWLTWFGRKRGIFNLPSRNKVIRVFQVIMFTLLAAIVLAHFEANWSIFAYCVDNYTPCPRDSEVIGLPIIPDTIAEIEAIVRHLLPPSMHNTCYTRNEPACQYTARYMVSQFAGNLFLPYPGIWFFSLGQALLTLAVVRHKFPEQRKQKRT